ncbi:hypothetical protein [Streptomyces morookaense]|uniref:Uncharacterized protein n=1 Tax=Streptomyces morookaense TaxID=1970 RepID=A0A7Y7B4K8_STRMO|nr:hypothetical protein [Streptomyces morookaense]NVK78919.1 hypothetical protein [Streptomyces morookaense]GHF36067.1 hypothetical protein GCM10010359_43550 [Streptomyces morookaense]
MDPGQRKRAIRALWIVGAVAVIAVVVTAWWRWDYRNHHARHTSLIDKVWLSDDDRTVSVETSWYPHCDGARPQLVAQESSGTVILRLERGMELKVPCDNEAGSINQVSVTLHSTLGSRRLVDASTGWDLKPSPR